MQPQRQINFNAIGDAFNIVTKNWQPFVIAGLLMVVTVGIVAVLFQFLIFASIMAGGNAGIFVLMLMSACMFIGIWTLISIFQAGIYRMAFRAIQGETPEVNDVFIALKNPGPYLVAGLLVGLCIGIGELFCYIPGLIAGGLLMFTIPFILEKGLAPVDAMKASVDTLKAQWLMATLFFLVAAIVGGLGAIACGIGAIFTMPITYVAIALTFRNLTEAGAAAPEAPAAPSA
jgi:uncharacterized membrane protein